MFSKILVANRGEIAVRIERTCHEMGIRTVALYESVDQGSLHVRLANECVLLPSRREFTNHQTILRIAQEKGVDAIHPGYGFLAESPAFARACGDAGITFIGPPAAVMEQVLDKTVALARVRAAGFATTEHSPRAYDENELQELKTEADRLGYPVAIKSHQGGRGRGERLVRSANHLEEWARRAQAEAQAVYGSRAIYLEKAILPAHQITVQIVADRYGQIIHLGEREGGLIQGNQKLVEESPAPCLTPAQRQELWQAALDIARLFNYENVGGVEFLIDENGAFHFTEIKARIHMSHPVTEMVSRVDLVREQIHIAAGRQLNRKQQDVLLQGHALACHLRAQDPAMNFMPSPGRLRRVRLPSGPEVRIDTYVYSGCDVPSGYDPLIAKLHVWDAERPACHARMERVLSEIKLTGTATNIAFLQQAIRDPEFANAQYTTEFYAGPVKEEPLAPTQLRDLAVAGAIAFMRVNQTFRPIVPDRLHSGWHRASRRLPQ
ncbi:MAG: biotin carboxylase N-terminal domain-containing protein [Anaerolineae bacterium]